MRSFTPGEHHRSSFILLHVCSEVSGHLRLCNDSRSEPSTITRSLSVQTAHLLQRTLSVLSWRQDLLWATLICSKCQWGLPGGGGGHLFHISSHSLYLTTWSLGLPRGSVKNSLTCLSRVLGCFGLCSAFLVNPFRFYLLGIPLHFWSAEGIVTSFFSPHYLSFHWDPAKEESGCVPHLPAQTLRIVTLLNRSSGENHSDHLMQTPH